MSRKSLPLKKSGEFLNERQNSGKLSLTASSFSELNNVLHAWERKNEASPNALATCGLGTSPQLSGDFLGTSPQVTSPDSLESSTTNLVLGSEYPMNQHLALREERKKQLKRRSKKKGKTEDASAKSSKLVISSTSSTVSLEALVLKSAVPDQLFSKLAEQVENGNPLLGIQILISLPADLQKDLFYLIHYPLLILEMLLMEENLELAEQVLSKFPELIDNSLLAAYATKALLIRFYESSLMPSTVSREVVMYSKKPASHDDVIISKIDGSFVIIWNYIGHWSDKLTGNVEQDKKIRSLHFFSGGTPNMNLAISILKLSKPKKLGQNCIDVCENLSESLGIMEEKEKLQTCSLMHELLIFTKQVFINETSKPDQVLDSSKVALCDSYLHDLEVLRLLVAGKATSKVSLIDLTDMTKVQKIRDGLIMQGKFELALDISTKYQFKTEPIWGAWGLSLLREGQLEQAREKFKYAFNSLDSFKGTVQVVLKSIMKTLRTEPKLESADTKEAKISSLPFDQRVNETVYYLSQYGPMQMLLQFWVGHQMFDKVLDYFTKSKPNQAMVDEFLDACKELNFMTEFHQAIQKIDPKIEIHRDLVLMICSYLNKKKEWQTLLLFQGLMEDYTRAALTCIKLFVEGVRTLSLEAKEEYLDKSLNFFLMEIQRKDRRENVLPPEQISKLMKKIKYQKELNFYFQEIVPPENLKFCTLFGPGVQKRALVSFVLLQNNFDLGIGIILNLRLSVLAIFSDIITTVVNQGEFDKVVPFLQKARVITQNPDEADQVVLHAMRLFVEKSKADQAGKWIDWLNSEENKINGLIVCGKLKSAYLQAVKLQRRDLIVKIRDEAQSKGFSTEYQLCEKYLNLSSSKPPSNQVSRAILNDN